MTQTISNHLIEQACQLIQAHVAGEDGALGSVTLNALADRLSVSPFALQKAFKAKLGITPREYANAHKAERFKEAVKEGQSVTEASYAAGYGSIRALYEQADATLGMSPGTYKKGGAGTDIVWAIAPCFLDLVILGATQQGVCFLALGDDRAYLVDSLKQEFRNARSITEDADLLKESLEDVIDYLTGKMPDPDLPLDIQATAFQRQVWRELWAIPPGQTLTYSEIADKLGMKSGQRAVARACASNNVSLLIPCHRCIRNDGGLGGYRWGINRKKLLLAMEEGQWQPQQDFALTGD